jgi:single-stranded-DNA-specific exonuclease
VPESPKAYRADPFSYPEARALADELGLSEPVAITLVRRGYRTPEAARAFLEADESHDPSAFDSMDEIAGRVLAVVREGGRITVHGDFDVDGVCATTIMVSTLRELGAECDWLIPDRLADGYGVSAANVERLAERGTSLILTVDCGVTAVEEVRLAGELGMEAIVTDHHQPGEELPDCPILHPVLSKYPFAELCGTAVSWKLACALREAAGGVGSPEADLDLVALATVADVVPLVGENRSLVKRGLQEVRRARRPGMRALLAAARCEPTRLDEGDLAFRLGPRINAAGRLYRADAGVELFLTEDEARAEEIAAELNRANGERRSAERQVDGAAEAARRELPNPLREAPGLVLAGRDWHPGVIGIVASRLAERHHRPAVVVSLDGEGGGRGSGRSIPGFDLLAGLEACSEHLVRFGGHRAAAGLELRAESLDAFREAFAAHATEVLGPEELRKTERIDAMVGGASLGLDLAEELGQLAPFGMGNPGVRLLVPSARVRDVRTMGEGDKHSRFSLHSGSHRALGVAFGRSKLGVGDDVPVDAAVRLEVNHWNGSVEPRVVLRELYAREAIVNGAGEAEAEAWWRRFEAELAAGLDERPPEVALPTGEPQRHAVRGANSPAATIFELLSSGAGVLALVADAPRRAALARDGLALADYAELERQPDLPLGFAHVVLVDPPPSAYLERLASQPTGEGGYLHPVWGEAEHRFALLVLKSCHAQRGELAAMFRDLRDAGEVSGEELRKALRGRDSHPRAPEVAARCFRVLAELDLVRGTPTGGDGTVGVVSSEGTELERSAAFRAYRARYEEGKRYLEGLRQP